MADVNKNWWKQTTIYQIYPRSFQDSNGDGLGDIPGIISRLDYLKDLGIDTIWLSPVFASPHRDHGYDISDYRGIDPLFGTLEDAEQLIDEIHKRDMKILFDMVLNHSSDQHPWFRESRQSRDNPKSDWYIWADGKCPGKPPNNWLSMTGIPAWQYEESRGQWYHCSFLDFQPDLNYRNPEVKKAMFDNVRFWLDKGVDGFRLDIFNSIFKDPALRDNPRSRHFFPATDNNDDAFFQKKTYSFNHPDCFPLARELRQLCDNYPGTMLLGEVTGSSEILRKFTGGVKQDGLQLVFQFELERFKFNARFFRNLLLSFEDSFPPPYMPTLVYGNHDHGRGISRIRGDREKAKLLALFQLSARGVPVMYYGDEIGMPLHDLPLKGAEDPLAVKYVHAPKALAEFAGIKLNRDDCRTPMIWTDEPHGGFCPSDVAPWLPLSDGGLEACVAGQAENPDSLLNFYKTLLALRRKAPALSAGELEVEEQGKPHVLSYIRRIEGEILRIILNFSPRERTYGTVGDESLLLSTRGDNHEKGRLKPLEGIILSR